MPTADRAEDAQIARLGDLSLAEIRDEWRHLHRSEPPRVSRDLLRRAIASELYARRSGGLSAFARRALRELAAGRGCSAPAPAGTRYVREWQGKVHVVTVCEDGRFAWNDRMWKSLSAIARAITGTRWSGPAFFGLKKSQ